jgi:hypothetical protein
MSMFLLPKTTIKNLDKQRRKFFWQGGSKKKKYHLIKWKMIYNDRKKRSGDKELEEDEYQFAL